MRIAVPKSFKRLSLRAAAISAIMQLAILMLAGCSVSSPTIIDLSFEDERTDLDPDTRTFRSIRRAGGLYLMTYYGDYEERLQWLDDYHQRKSAEQAAPSACSLFTVKTEAGHPLLGRNFDRYDRSPVLARFVPPGKYASFAFIPDDAGQHVPKWLAAGEDASEELKNKLLYSLPFFAADGINEKGLAIAVAGAPIRQVKHSESRKPMFVLLFIRRVLDNCQTVEEVAEFAETVSIYDRDFNTVSHHFLAVDSAGRWLVIDFPDGEVRLTRGSGEPQVRTNHLPDSGEALSEARTTFSRYDTLSRALNSPPPPSSDTEAIRLLKQVRNGTVWSVVYDLQSRSGLVAVRENYRKLYRFGFPPPKR